MCDHRGDFRCAVRNISLSEEDLDKLNQLCEEGIFTSRSEAIRMALMMFAGYYIEECDEPIIKRLTVALPPYLDGLYQEFKQNQKASQLFRGAIHCLFEHCERLKICETLGQRAPLPHYGGQWA